jgi:hypothetical protein
MTTFLIGVSAGIFLTTLTHRPPRRRKPRDIYGPLHKWGHPPNPKRGTR